MSLLFPQAESVRQKLSQRHRHKILFVFRRDDPEVIAAEFRHDLTANTAGPAVILTFADDSDGGKFPRSCGNGAAESHTLGTEARAVGSVFHITSDIYRSTLCQQRCPYSKAGIGSDGIFPALERFPDQLFFRHVNASTPQLAPMRLHPAS